MSTEKTTHESGSDTESKPRAIEHAVSGQRTAYSKSQMNLIKSQICKGASDDELALFVATSQRMGLDPFARQIWGVMRPTKDGDVLSIQVSIDGFRLIAARTNRYEGQVGPFYCGADRKWTDTWVSDEHPLIAKVGVMVFGAREPTFGYAKYSSYVQRYSQSGDPTPIWQKFPDMMLGKCAEAIALRKMFPAELSGIYSPEEMAGQDFIENPEDPNALSSEDRLVMAPVIIETESCKTKAEIDALINSLKGRGLSPKVKKIVWSVMQARAATIAAMEKVA